jgi:hypothetical protein
MNLELELFRSLKIMTVAERTSCSKHKARPGIPCWAIFGGVTGNTVIGVCGRRARAAGMTGRIKRSSLVRTQFKSKS